MMAWVGVHVLVTLEASAQAAHSGRRVEAGANEQEGTDEWGI